MNNTISKQFNIWQLLKFSLPSIMMLIITSLYTAVDGAFVSQFAGSNALSSINIILPLDFMLCGIAIMLGTGSSAIIGKYLGEGKTDKANNALTIITIFGIVIGLIFTIIIFMFLPQILTLLGANDILMPYCMVGGRIMFAFSISYIIQVMYQMLFVTAGKPKLAMYITLACGILNIVLDYVFIVLLNMGVAGAALGTVTGRTLGAVLSILYFFKKRGTLHFVKPKKDKGFLLKSITNGSSELVSNVAAGVITFLFNIIIMKIAGADGVAAVTIILYTQFICTAIFMGFSNSIAPIFSYNYGSKNTDYLKKLFSHCIIIISAFTLMMFSFSYLGAEFLIKIFTPKGTAVFDLAYNGYMIFVFNFLFAGFNMFASGLFTSLSNGKISASISFLRTFGFIVTFILVLPNFIGINGLWLAIPLAEFCTFFIAAILVKKGGKTYGYLK